MVFHNAFLERNQMIALISGSSERTLKKHIFYTAGGCGRFQRTLPKKMDDLKEIFFDFQIRRIFVLIMLSLLRYIKKKN